MSQAMHCRPSDILGQTDPITRFYVDRATWTFASIVEDEMKAATDRLPDRAKPAAHARARQRVLNDYLGIEDSTQKHQFRAPGHK